MHKQQAEKKHVIDLMTWSLSVSTPSFFFFFSSWCWLFFLFPSHLFMAQPASSLHTRKSETTVPVSCLSNPTSFRKQREIGIKKTSRLSLFQSAAHYFFPYTQSSFDIGGLKADRENDGPLLVGDEWDSLTLGSCSRTGGRDLRMRARDNEGR